ncbi:hypothetical protein HDU91_003281, partial [Kappamyces sp. JEL0680]
MSSTATLLNALAPEQPSGCGFFSSKPEQVGDVARPGGYSINYELHGTGSIRVLCIIGYMASMAGWDPVLAHFLGRRSNYQFLVLDNRGVGMAEDVIAVLQHIGWTDDRSVHLCGLSMGGMIAQELAYLIPTRFKSLALMVTCAKHSAKKEHRGKTERTYVRHLFSQPKTRLRAMTDINFSDAEWLDAADDRYPEFSTNRERMIATFSHRIENSPRSGLKPLIGQGMAVKTHNMTADRLQTIAASIPHIR